MQQGGVSITSGATVTVNVYNAAGTLDSGPHSASNGGSGDDWYYDLTAPSTAGQYQVKVTATVNSAVGKGTLLLTVKPF